jgi:hypothetical protein
MYVMSFLFLGTSGRGGGLLNVSFLGWEKKQEVLHSKFTAASYLVKGQFLCDSINWVKFVVLHDGILRLVLSIKEGQTFVPRQQG